MGIIRLKDINFDELERIHCKSNCEARLYTDNRICYKIFLKERYTPWQLHGKYKKIKLLAKTPENALDSVVLPIDRIINKKGGISGYTMRFIPDSRTLSCFKAEDTLLISKVLYEISQSVRKIHQDSRNIIISDLHFDNILINKNYQHYFVDFDSCSINGIPNETSPTFLSSYEQLVDSSRYRIIKETIRELKGYPAYTETSQKTDRLCLILATLKYFFDKSIISISESDYDKKCEEIPFLNNMKSYFLYLKKYPKGLEVPYLDEFIPEPSKILKK